MTYVFFLECNLPRLHSSVGRAPLTDTISVIPHTRTHACTRTRISLMSHVYSSSNACECRWRELCPSVMTKLVSVKTRHTYDESCRSLSSLPPVSSPCVLDYENSVGEDANSVDGDTKFSHPTHLYTLSKTVSVKTLYSHTLHTYIYSRTLHICDHMCVLPRMYSSSTAFECISSQWILWDSVCHLVVITYVFFLECSVGEESFLYPHSSPHIYPHSSPTLLLMW